MTKRKSFGRPERIVMADDEPFSVIINLKHASNRIYAGLEKMHNSIKPYNADMSWLDSFQEHFGIKLDARKYTVRRAGDGATKHDLKEEVRILIGEFKRGRSTYSVQLVENQRRPSNPNSNASRAAEQSFGSAKSSKKTPVVVDQNGHSRMNNSTSSPLATTRIKVKAKRAGVKKVAAAAVDLPRGISPGKNQNGLSQSRISPTKMIARVVKKPVSSGRIVKTRGPSPTPPRLRPQSAVAAPVEDFDDACSVYTSATQNSQEDLEEQGIEYLVDFQTKVIGRAKCLSNGQLCQARDDLQKLKASAARQGGRNKWTKWCMTCPLAVTLLRDLLDV